MKERTDMTQNDQPILIAYDGSEYAKAAIEQAGEQLRDGRRAIVLTVWQPLSPNGFVGTPGVAPVGLEEDVEREAHRVAEEGAALARGAGFEAKPLVARGDPTWERIVESADEHDASIVVMGSHGRTGISRMLLGSVAGTAASHTPRPVLIAHDGARPSIGSSPRHISKREFRR
jgi:nucleotide-binding universal stress UspA family protein